MNANVTTPSLLDRMRALALTHPRGHELVEQADTLDAATSAFGQGRIDADDFMFHWITAMHLWVECVSR